MWDSGVRQALKREVRYTSKLGMSVEPIPLHIVAIKRPRESLLRYYALKATATNLAFPFVFPYLYFRYHTMRYPFDTDGIHMKWGVIFRREVLLNYSRIQDIHLRSNLIERWLGLARIEIQTASGSANANMTLEGMEDPEGMRDFLYARMRGRGERKPGQRLIRSRRCCMRSPVNCVRFARWWRSRAHANYQWAKDVVP
jgi:membrane protein YdbS with pleckstrin-like domain